MLMRYHSGLGIGHIGIPSSNRYTAGMEVDLEENTTSLGSHSTSLDVNDGECILGLEEEELQQRDEEQVDEPDDQDSDYGAYDEDAHSDLEDDCNSLASIGGSNIDFEEAYDD